MPSKVSTADFWHRIACSRLRLSLGLALLLLLFLPHAWPSVLRALTAWDAAIFVLSALGWRVILSSDAARTRQLSRQQDEKRSIIDSLLVVASFASLGGVLMALAKAQNAFEFGLTLTAILTVVVSWILIHTLYAFHYARLYYDVEGKGGGINFHGDEPPDYLDFCYLSFAVGTTFGATDSEIGGREIRRTILKHGVFSFAYATIVVSLAISVVSNLLSGS